MENQEQDTSSGTPDRPKIPRDQFQITYTNRAYKHWPEIFNNDNTLTSALLDRVLHHAETCVVEGKSFRAKDHTPEA
jgi:DNA replication protein DnaC